MVVKDNRDSGEEIETGLKKFGAMLGDHVEVGCNSDFTLEVIEPAPIWDL